MAGINIPVNIPSSAFSQLDKLTKALQQVQNAAKSTAVAGPPIVMAINAVIRSATNAIKVIGSLTGVYLGLRAVMRGIKSGVTLAEDITRAEALFTILEGSADRARNSVQRFLDLAASSPFDFKDIQNGARYFHTLGVASLTSTKNLRAVANAAFIANTSFMTTASNIGRTLDDIRSGRNVGQSVYSLNRTGLLSASARNQVEKLQKEGSASSNKRAWQVILNDLQQANGATEALNKTFDGVTRNIQTRVTQAFAKLIQPIQQGLVPALNTVYKIISSIDVSKIAAGFAYLFSDVINPALRIAWHGMKVIWKESEAIRNSIYNWSLYTIIAGLRVTAKYIRNISLAFGLLLDFVPPLFERLKFRIVATTVDIVFSIIDSFAKAFNFVTEAWFKVQDSFVDGWGEACVDVQNLFLELKDKIISTFVGPIATALGTLTGGKINASAVVTAANATTGKRLSYTAPERDRSGRLIDTTNVLPELRFLGTYSRQNADSIDPRYASRENTALFSTWGNFLSKPLDRISDVVVKAASGARPLSFENNYAEPTFKAADETAKNTRKMADYMGKIFNNRAWEAQQVSIGLNKGAVGFGLGTIPDRRATERFSAAADRTFNYLNSVNKGLITSG